MKIKKINGKSNIIGKNLKKYRELRELTQRQLCDRLELFGLIFYPADINNFEHESKAIKDFEVKGLCKALNISLEQIYENTDQEYE